MEIYEIVWKVGYKMLWNIMQSGEIWREFVMGSEEMMERVGYGK